VLYFSECKRLHNCSPAASFTNFVMTLYLLKVPLQTFLSIPITQKCQILGCDTLAANERHVTLNSVLSTSQYKRVQERCGQTVHLRFVLYFGATHPIFGRVENESSCGRTITICNKFTLILQIKRIT
jgi:hypothetical protein